MYKMSKQEMLHYNTEMFDGWKYCVSTSTSLMSLSWIEHFFSNRKEASDFRKEAEQLGYVTLMVTPDEY